MAQSVLQKVRPAGNLRKHFISIQPRQAQATQNQGELPSLRKLGTDPGACKGEATLIRVKLKDCLKTHVLLPVRRGTILNSVEAFSSSG